MDSKGNNFACKTYHMSQKARKITGWALTVLVALVMAASAIMKLTGGEEAARAAAAMGLTKSSVHLIALVELTSVLLFVIPRTGVLGTLLLAAYLGGAMVTHILNGQPFVAPAIAQGLVWITAVIRFPELLTRLAGKKINAQAV